MSPPPPNPSPRDWKFNLDTTFGSCIDLTVLHSLRERERETRETTRYNCCLQDMQTWETEDDLSLGGGRRTQGNAQMMYHRNVLSLGPTWTYEHTSSRKATLPFSRSYEVPADCARGTADTKCIFKLFFWPALPCQHPKSTLHGVSCWIIQRGSHLDDSEAAPPPARRRWARTPPPTPNDNPREDCTLRWSSPGGMSPQGPPGDVTEGFRCHDLGERGV